MVWLIIGIIGLAIVIFSYLYIHAGLLLPFVFFGCDDSNLDLIILDVDLLGWCQNPLLYIFPYAVLGAAIGYFCVTRPRVLSVCIMLLLVFLLLLGIYSSFYIFESFYA